MVKRNGDGVKENPIAIAMQNTRKYNLLLWCFIGFPSTPAFGTASLLHFCQQTREKISNDKSKFLTHFYGRLFESICQCF